MPVEKQTCQPNLILNINPSTEQSELKIEKLEVSRFAV